MGKIWVRDDMQAGGCLHRHRSSRGTPSPTSGDKRQEWEVEEVLFHPNYNLNAKKAKNEEIKSDMRLIERKHLNGSYKFEHINNHIKYE